MNSINDARLRALPGYNLRRAYAHIIGSNKNWMQRYEIGIVDYAVLVLIDANPRVRATQLCDTLGVAKPNMATLIERLVKREWITRERSPIDARVSLLSLTAQGTRVARAAEAAARQNEAATLAHLSQSDLAQLCAVLQKVYGVACSVQD